MNLSEVDKWIGKAAIIHLKNGAQLTGPLKANADDTYSIDSGLKPSENEGFVLRVGAEDIESITPLRS